MQPDAILVWDSFCGVIVLGWLIDLSLLFLRPFFVDDQLLTSSTISEVVSVRHGSRLIVHNIFYRSFICILPFPIKRLNSDRPDLVVVVEVRAWSVLSLDVERDLARLSPLSESTPRELTWSSPRRSELVACSSWKSREAS